MKTPYILKLPRTHEIFSRPSIFYSIDDDWNVVDKEEIPRVPNVIVCDGCNTLIETDEINCLVFTEGYIHSAQCDDCVKKYFSKLKVKREE